MGGMTNTNTAHLDAVLARNTAILTFAELLATDAHYVPTLDMRQDAALLDVAHALVNAGRNAHVVAPSGARVKASDLGFIAPEVLAAEYGIIVKKPAPVVAPAPAQRRLKGIIFATKGNVWKVVGSTRLKSGFRAVRWNRAQRGFNKSPSNHTFDAAFILANECPRPARAGSKKDGAR